METSQSVSRVGLCYGVCLCWEETSLTVNSQEFVFFIDKKVTYKTLVGEREYTNFVNIQKVLTKQKIKIKRVLLQNTQVKGKIKFVFGAPHTHTRTFLDVSLYHKPFITSCLLDFALFTSWNLAMLGICVWFWRWPGNFGPEVENTGCVLSKKLTAMEISCSDSQMTSFL